MKFLIFCLLSLLAILSVYSKTPYPPLQGSQVTLRTHIKRSTTGRLGLRDYGEDDLIESDKYIGQTGGNSEIDYEKERGPRSLVERKNKKETESENIEISIENSSNIKRQQPQFYFNNPRFVRKIATQEKDITEFENERFNNHKIPKRAIPIPPTPPTTSTTESYGNKGIFRTCYNKCVKTNEFDPLCAEVNGVKRQFTNPEELECTIFCGQSASFLYKGSCTTEA